MFPEADITFVIEKLKKMATNYPTLDNFLVDLLKKMDKNQNGCIEFEELIVGLQELGFTCNYQEAYTLMRYFDTDENWQLNLKELFEGLGGKRE